MKDKRKILISDYDGTFDAGDNIENNVLAIKKFRDNNNLFVLATGRALPSIKEFIKKYSIPFDYLIIDNGASVIDSEYRVLDTVVIPDEDYIVLMNYFNSKGIYKDDMIFYNTLNWFVSETDGPFTKIEVKRDSIEAIMELYEDYQKHITLPAYLQSKHCSFELMARGVNKARAIIWIKKYLNNDNIHVIGNSANDLEMIKRHNGYAVVGSTDEIIKNSNKIFRTVEDCINYINNENS